MAACNPIGNPSSPQMVNWSSGSPITNVAHISANGDADVVVVTEDGKAYSGYYSSVSETPIIDSGAISSTGGKHPMCILTGDANSKDVLCGHNGQLSRPGLPSDFNAVQISASYGFICALNTDGEVWCWNDGGNSGGGLSSVLSDTPSKFPFDEPMVFVSAGQNSVCGIRQSGGLKCKFSYYDARYLPAISQSSLAETPDDFMPNAIAFQATYGKGVVINKDGSAVYLPGENGLSGVGNVVSAGGHRGAITVVNDAGDVFLVDGGNATQVNSSYRAEAASCALQ